MLLKGFIFLLTAYLATAAVIFPQQLEGDIDERIWNGKDAAAGQFPYQALLYMTNNDGNHSFCGGSLASTTYILTAAHCCQGVSSTRVFLGLLKVDDNQASWVQRFDVPSSDFKIHEDYDNKTIANDICILKLPSPAQLNANVSLIALPTQNDSNPSQYDWKSASISGWGQTNDFEGIHPNLQWSTVTLKPHFLCALAYTFINQISNSQLCSSKIPWTGPCHGDSGGPLTVKDSSGKEVEIGLVSWGVGPCGSFNPVVYTYIPAYVGWIQTNMK